LIFFKFEILKSYGNVSPMGGTRRSWRLFTDLPTEQVFWQARTVDGYPPFCFLLNKFTAFCEGG
jgi:hypothetical protein